MFAHSPNVVLTPPPEREKVKPDGSREDTVSLLGKQREFEIVGEAANGREALGKARELMPDIILMDISMPEMGGLEATRRIKQQIPYVRIVMLTVSDNDQHLFEAIKAGAHGYLLKKIEPRAFLNKLRDVARGEASVTQTMATKLIGEFARQAGPVRCPLQAPILNAVKTHAAEDRARRFRRAPTTMICLSGRPRLRLPDRRALSL